MDAVSDIVMCIKKDQELMQRKAFHGQRKECPMSDDYSAMLLPKASWKQTDQKKGRRKNTKVTSAGKIPSIMQQEDDNRCYLCMLLEGNYLEQDNLEEHHVLFGALHKLSDWYGLRVKLCPRHHRNGPEAVHNNRENARLLMKIAQLMFMTAYPRLNWIKVIEVNYWEDEDETT